MKTIKPGELSTAQWHAHLLSAIAPRPIALASTVDENGLPNLSPFSFFNIFSSNPPIAIFSPARRVRDNSTKHTLENVKKVPEVVINVVNYDIVHQTSLSSTEYAKGVNEFIKSGLTPIASEKIKPLRVAESPVQFECKVNDVMPLGTEGGAGNLIICEILLMHVKEEVMNEKGQIDQKKIDLVARLGADWYCRASGSALFEVPKPNTKIGMGYEALPEEIKLSRILSGNDLAMLANVEKLPDGAEVAAFRESPEYASLMEEYQLTTDKNGKYLAAKHYLSKQQIENAWKVLI